MKHEILTLKPHTFINDPACDNTSSEMSRNANHCQTKTQDWGTSLHFVSQITKMLFCCLRPFTRLNNNGDTLFNCLSALRCFLIHLAETDERNTRPPRYTRLINFKWELLWHPRNYQKLWNSTAGMNEEVLTSDLSADVDCLLVLIENEVDNGFKCSTAEGSTVTWKHLTGTIHQHVPTSL